MRINFPGAVLPLLAVAVAGCAITDDEPVCTAMMAYSGVSVAFSPQAGTSYRLCVGAVCSAKNGDRGQLEVTLPDSVGAKKVSVRFTGTAAGESRPRLDERTEVTLHRWEVNGPGCGPIVYRAGLVLSGEGLVTRPD